jgi:hypothetical protein
MIAIPSVLRKTFRRQRHADPEHTEIISRVSRPKEPVATAVYAHSVPLDGGHGTKEGADVAGGSPAQSSPLQLS